MNQIVKVCKIHGNLTIDQVRKDGKQLRCTACRMETNRKTYYKHREKRVATSQAWKEKNREKYRLWAREDRAKYPEKYQMLERKRREKEGSKIVLNEILRMHSMTKDEYEQLVKDQNNLCAICRNVETRKARILDVPTRLSIDHCHYCEQKSGHHVVRGLLCHACNTAIGKFKDNIDLLEKAILYLRKHTCK